MAIKRSFRLPRAAVLCADEMRIASQGFGLEGVIVHI